MIRVEVLTGAALQDALPDVARLRIGVFREWPYLYDGDTAYEERYLQSYATSEGAIVVAAMDEDEIVGAATGMPLRHHAEEFAGALDGSGLPLDNVFYCAESVLLPEYRGKGLGHSFFDMRENHARALGLGHSAFCAVIRDPDHPGRPEAYRPLDGFWRKRGYAPIPGAVARFDWKEVGLARPTTQSLQFWARAL
ncbi:GNAT family N-acetyltransferase [Pseudaestuariivita atlantica]|uniref:GNAT family acetyltransferase n=1 Tax=Pseudaestuariivita atlantica TaxID=1317121 RepID=A0A0L1JV41_9RHOB|nr:GNAT family N-acetyltransferase [Pseudaestuariivita atlantica]KNG95268.1 GNAT family acetyltransferase [Pseudaestuariivita atlantica]